MMGKKKKKEQEFPDEGALEQTDAGATELDEPIDELDALRNECEELKGRWQRAAADYQNLKRRQLTDIEAAVRRSQAPLLEDALIVLDYLDMAISSPVTEPEAKNLMIGVEMTRQQFIGVLERQDIKPIATEGTFDPGMHQAVGTIETEEHEAGTIMEATRTGWTWRGQVLRPAQVRVATSESAEEAKASDQDQGEASDASATADA
ncbi:MAG: molecular chaperone GrpE [Planctomycetota bacterium]|jgi:molecular chaperone GrpE